MMRNILHINNYSSLKSLSNNSLITSYNKAMEKKLDKEFIQLLEDEIKKRNLYGEKYINQTCSSRN
ncbi:MULTISPECIES: sporulation histidine kinase inhibitor Sda [Bacillus]|uniref:sporulation histidine kinase inhibitor Sda n=1 Tax=Bacillus TaxID=1386 RepID=UPI000BB7220E|nr:MULTISPECIES: sporulation histidine kinase inhibitor Sda [Bacillus]